MATNADPVPQGSLALPADVLKRLSLRAGDTIQLAELGGVTVRIVSSPSVTELALEIEQMIEDAGLGMDEFLDSLYKERERYTREKYGLSG